MSFTTLTFVVFLVGVFSLYWSTASRRLQNIILLCASYFFYGWWDYRYCSLILVSTLVDYWVGRMLERTSESAARRVLLLTSCLANLGMLGVFKYFNFFAENLGGVMRQLGWHVDSFTLRVALPVGISFYTFQTMSYTIDVYRRKIRPTHDLIDYMAFVSFFPQLVAGPIERGGRLLPQFLQRREFNYADAADGCRRILWGFFKKRLLANNLGRFVEICYASPQEFDGLTLAFATVCFAFQIYCDFSAYSDIAIGTAKLFGFDLMPNFAYPYFAESIPEFWRRWHISLSTWFRDYLFIPLGGSRGGQWSTAFNVMVTFIVSGLWHGASWSFIFWGALNGIYMMPSLFRRRGQKRVATDVPGGESVFPSVWVLARMIRTFALICVTWIFFRTETLEDAFLILGRIGSDLLSNLLVVFGWNSMADPALDMNIVMVAMMLLLAPLILSEWWGRYHPHPLALGYGSRPFRWGVYTALVWSTFYFLPQKSSQFIYFQF